MILAPAILKGVGLLYAVDEGSFMLVSCFGEISVLCVEQFSDPEACSGNNFF